MEFSITPDHCRVCLKRTAKIGKFLHDKFALLEQPSSSTAQGTSGAATENRTYLDIYQQVTGAVLSAKPSSTAGAAFFPQRICDNCEAQLLVAYEFRRKSGRSERVLANVLSFYEDDGGGSGSVNSFLVKEEPVEEEYAEECSVSVGVLGKAEDHKASVVEAALASSSTDKDPLVEFDRQLGHDYEIVSEGSLDQDDEVGYIIEEEFTDDVEGSDSNDAGDLCEAQLTEPTKSKTSLCPDCGKMISHRYLQKHRETHKDKGDRVKPFECDQCQSRFTLKENLNKHKRIHSQEKKYACPYCGKQFLHWASRRYHVDSMHTGELRYDCTYCGSKFRNSSQYAIHLRKHQGITPFPCHMCDRSFTNGLALKHHLTTHSDVKSVVCTYENCTKAYKTRKALRIHIRMAHEQERNYVCPVCQKAYSQNHVLRTHMLRHHPHHVPPPPGTVMSKKALKKMKAHQRMLALQRQPPPPGTVGNEQL